jgi:hypothetical protein
MTWKEFLRTHWDVIAATDFLTAEVWTPAGLIRYHVLFEIRLATRDLRIAGIGILRSRRQLGGLLRYYYGDAA